MPGILRIYYEPQFHLCFSGDEIHALIALATNHENPVCHETSRPGGFLHELRALLEAPQDVPKCVVSIGERYEERVFSLDDVELLGKILERLECASADIQAALQHTPPIVTECLQRKRLEEAA